MAPVHGVGGDGDGGGGGGQPRHQGQVGQRAGARHRLHHLLLFAAVFHYLLVFANNLLMSVCNFRTRVTEGLSTEQGGNWCGLFLQDCGEEKLHNQICYKTHCGKYRTVDKNE